MNRSILVFAAIFVTLAVALGQSLDTRTIVITDPNTNVADVAAAIKPQLSPLGKIEVNTATHQIVITETAAGWLKLDPILHSMSGSRPNVRVEISSDTFINSNKENYGVPTQLTTHQSGPINTTRVGTSQDYSVEDELANRARHSTEAMVVQSGEVGYLSLGDHVPYVQSFAVGPAQAMGAVAWQNVGTRVAIRPTVLGDAIRLEIFPQISAMVNGAAQTLSYSDFGTVITIPNNGSATVGGFTQAGADFNKGFFHVDQKHAVYGQGFVVRARVEDGTQPPSHNLDEVKPQMYKEPTPTAPTK